MTDQSPAVTPTTAQSAERRPLTRGTELGSTIAAVFGMVFVVVNSTGIGSTIRTLLIALAGVAAVVVLVLSASSLRQRAASDESDHRTQPTDRREPPLGRAYWLVVAVEAVALFGGSRVLSALGHPELGVAWVAFVVGTHFFALGKVFGLTRFHLLAAVITVLGLAGFALRLLGLISPIAVVSGVLSGFVLLAFALWAHWTPRARQ